MSINNAFAGRVKKIYKKSTSTRYPRLSQKSRPSVVSHLLSQPRFSRSARYRDNNPPDDTLVELFLDHGRDLNRVFCSASIRRFIVVRSILDDVLGGNFVSVQRIQTTASLHVLMLCVISYPSYMRIAHPLLRPSFTLYILLIHAVSLAFTASIASRLPSCLGKYSIFTSQHRTSHPPVFLCNTVLCKQLAALTKELDIDISSTPSAHRPAIEGHHRAYYDARP